MKSKTPYVWLYVLDNNFSAKNSEEFYSLINWYNFTKCEIWLRATLYFDYSEAESVLVSSFLFSASNEEILKVA